MKMRGFRITASLLSVCFVWATTAAVETVHPLCSLVLHQEQMDREDQRLAVELAVSQLAATESILVLFAQLWEQDAVEEMVYLTAKRNHDVAEIQVRRQRLLLKRQEAEVEQYSSVCADPGSRETATHRRARLDEAHRQYLQIDCHRIGEDLAIAEVELAYSSKFLDSVQDLREHEFATEGDVIFAERNTELGRKRVDYHERQVRECENSGAVGGNGRNN